MKEYDFEEWILVGLTCHERSYMHVSDMLPSVGI